MPIATLLTSRIGSSQTCVPSESRRVSTPDSTGGGAMHPAQFGFGTGGRPGPGTPPGLFPGVVAPTPVRSDTVKRQSE